MVNIEKNNQEHRTTKPRKIEVYRKTLTEPTEPGIQSEEDETEKPKIINKEDKIFFINLGLMVSFIVFFSCDSYIFFIIQQPISQHIKYKQRTGQHK